MPQSDCFIEYGVDHPFPIQNLPYGIFSTDANPQKRPGVAIGDLILDLHAVSKSRWFQESNIQDPSLFQQETLNAFISQPKQIWSTFRRFLQTLLAKSSPLASSTDRDSLFVNRLAKSTRLHLPIKVGEFTDFYSSLEHATNCGTILRGADNALQPNWKWIPVGYHGRASSIVVSGTPFHRPSGQILPQPGANQPVFAPCQRLDFELEMGFIYGGEANKQGQRLSPLHARENLFGCFLLNDWSARDIQAWKYVPLGPFLSKNFCTTVSPWIVTCEALEPFKVPEYTHEPELLAYLQEPGGYNYDVPLEISIKPNGNSIYTTISQSSLKHTFYTPAQMLSHHTASGCRMNPCDVFGTGTLSAPTHLGFGSLLEKSKSGKEPFYLSTEPAKQAGDKVNEEQVGDEKVSRTFLQDGDSVVMTGLIKGDGYCIGFGECEGTVLAALE